MDDETLRKAGAGDARAERTLGRWLAHELTVFYRGYGDRETVMELSQKTAVDLLVKLRASDGPRSLAELSDSIQRFGMIQARREATEKTRQWERAEKLAAYAVEQELESPVSLEAALAGTEQRALLKELIDALPERLRKSLELRRAGHTYASIAERMGMSESSAHRTVEAALGRLGREYARARKTRSEFRSSKAS